MRLVFFIALLFLSVNASAQHGDHHHGDRASKALLATPQDSVKYKMPVKKTDTLQHKMPVKKNTGNVQPK